MLGKTSQSRLKHKASLFILEKLKWGHSIKLLGDGTGIQVIKIVWEAGRVLYAICNGRGEIKYFFVIKQRMGVLNEF